MSASTPATAAEARDVAEEAREAEWAHPSFVREMFLGRFRLDLIHPFPERHDPVEAERAAAFFGKLREFLERYPSDAIDATGDIPEPLVQELRDMGAFGIKIPEEYGGLGLSQVSYISAMEMVGTKDGSLGVHNTVYAVQLLQRTYERVTGVDYTTAFPMAFAP